MRRTRVADLARELLALGVDVVATDGTREALAADGIAVRAISELTHAAPLIGGQVKTFHPAVYAGILARRDVPEQLAELAAQGIGFVNVDQPMFRGSLPPTAVATSRVGYVRIHGRNVRDWFRAGATREEVTETAMLAAALRAGAAVTHGALAVKLFDQAGASQAAGAETRK